MSRRRKLWIGVGSVLLLGVIVCLFVPIYGKAETFTELDRNMIRLIRLGASITAFRDDLDGKYPESLRALIPDHLNEDDFRKMLYRDAVSQRTYDWLYFGGFAGETPGTAIIAASPSAQLCPKGMMHHRIVLFASGGVRFVTDEEFQKTIAEQMPLRKK